MRSHSYMRPPRKVCREEFSWRFEDHLRGPTLDIIPGGKLHGRDWELRIRIKLGAGATNIGSPLRSAVCAEGMASNLVME